MHKRKVQDVRQWLLESFKGGISGSLRKQRVSLAYIFCYHRLILSQRILVLSGPAGTGKTATVRTLSKELGFDIMEWKIDADERWYPGNSLGGFFDLPCSASVYGIGLDYESISEKLEDFLSRSSAYGSVLAAPPIYPESQARSSNSQPSTSTQPPAPTPLAAAGEASGHRLILIEDLPNISHAQTQSAFHDALTRFVETKSAIGTPMVIIVSDEGRRGAELENSSHSRSETKVDIRSVLPKSLLGSRYATEIK